MTQYRTAYSGQKGFTLNRAVTLLMTALFSLVVLWGCTDDDSSESDDVRLEKALNDRDYDYIIGKLSYLNYENSSNPDYWVFTPAAGLSYRHIYLLQMACIGKSGFDIKNIIKELYDDDADSVQIIIESLNDGGEATGDDLKVMRYWINNNKDIADTMANGNKDIEFAAGWAGTLDVILILAQISADLSATPVSFDKTDPNYIGNIFKGMTDSQIDAAVHPYVSDIEDNIRRVEDVVDDLDVGDGEDKGKIKEKLDDFTDDIKDSSGAVSDASVREFIKNKVVKVN